MLSFLVELLKFKQLFKSSLKIAKLSTYNCSGNNSQEIWRKENWYIIHPFELIFLWFRPSRTLFEIFDAQNFVAKQNLLIKIYEYLSNITLSALQSATVIFSTWHFMSSFDLAKCTPGFDTLCFHIFLLTFL